MVSHRQKRRFWKLALGFSVAANLAMVLLVIVRPHFGQDLETPISTDRDPLPTAERMPAETAPSESKSDGRRWNDIASDDFRRYVENLRDLGCPEKIIADLLVPEINRVFGRQATANYIPRVAAAMLFTPDSEWEQWMPNIDRSELEAKRERLMEDLFGKGRGNRRSWNDSEQWGQRVEVSTDSTAFLGPELQETMNELSGKRWQLAREMKKLEPRPNDKEIDAAVRTQFEIDLEHLTELGGEELSGDYRLRMSKYASLARDVPGIEFSADEMRQIVRELERKAGRSAQLEKIRQLIGEERFGVFAPAVREKLD